MTIETSETEDAPVIRRIRHETRRRALTVESVERVSPAMIRVTLGGPELEGFVSGAADDHIKVLFPREGGDPEMRDYTPRRHSAGRLTVDFVDHEGGPAATWARAARAGDTVTIAGPRGSRVIEGAISDWLFIGDETALPAIGRFVEELPAGVRATLLVSIPSAADAQDLTSAADVYECWLPREGGDPADPAPLLAALAEVEIAPRCFVWVAAEAGVARALRAALLARGHSPRWLRAAGYWVAGEADASVKEIEDPA